MNADQYFGPGTIYVPDTSDWNRIFDSNLSYNKASWVPHMLRGMVGDTTFFQILRAYHNQLQVLRPPPPRTSRRWRSVSGLRPDAVLPGVDLRRVLPDLPVRLDGHPGGRRLGHHPDRPPAPDLAALHHADPGRGARPAPGTRPSRSRIPWPARTTSCTWTTQPTAVALDPDHWILRDGHGPAARRRPSPGHSCW